MPTITDRKKPIPVKIIAYGVGLLNLGMLSVGIFHFFTLPADISTEFDFSFFSFILSAIAYSLLALLIISRQPRHMIGWLFLLVGFLTSLWVIGINLENSVTLDISSQIRLLSSLVVSLVWAPMFFTPLSVVLLIFPDGRLPTKRWWPVLAITIIGLGGIMLHDALLTWFQEAVVILEIDTPFRVSGDETFFTRLNLLSNTFFMIGVLGSLAALVVRYIRSRVNERTQMKWLVYVAGVGISLMILMSLILGSENQFLSIFATLFPTVLALAMSIAILRYRLFDIDILIRRTLQYSLLTGILGLIYFGGVILLQASVSALTGRTDSPLVVVLSTLSIAALFNPLRLRVQDFIDRRFYRAKYDAEKALARFAATTREEVDLEILCDAILDVVDETVRPERASIWMQESGSNKQ